MAKTRGRGAEWAGHRRLMKSRRHGSVVSSRRVWHVWDECGGSVVASLHSRAVACWGDPGAGANMKATWSASRRVTGWQGFGTSYLVL